MYISHEKNSTIDSISNELLSISVERHISNLQHEVNLIIKYAIIKVHVRVTILVQIGGIIHN